MALYFNHPDNVRWYSTIIYWYICCHSMVISMSTLVHFLGSNHLITAIRFYHSRHLIYQRLPSILPHIVNVFTIGQKVPTDNRKATGTQDLSHLTLWQ